MKKLPPHGGGLSSGIRSEDKFLLASLNVSNNILFIGQEWALVLTLKWRECNLKCNLKVNSIWKREMRKKKCNRKYKNIEWKLKKIEKINSLIAKLLLRIFFLLRSFSKFNFWVAFFFFKCKFLKRVLCLQENGTKFYPYCLSIWYFSFQFYLPLSQIASDFISCIYNTYAPLLLSLHYSNSFSKITKH